MKVDAAIIGGTGVGTLLAQEPGRTIHIPTRYGVVGGRLIAIGPKSVLLLSRHSAGHSVPPHKVNYRGMAMALQQVGVGICFATAAVGSLSVSRPVGTFVACSDFLDLSGRNLTLHDDQVVHTPFAQPFGPRARAAILSSKQFQIEDGGTYLGLNGPRFETPHEIQMLSAIGDVVGMTAASEAILMKEAGIEYGLLAIVTNLGEGLGGPVEHGLVGDVMHSLGPQAVKIMKSAVEAVSE